VKRFVLDANVFIEASKRYYPFDICPGFWEAVILQHEKKHVFSIDRVKKELEEGEDRLKQWANETAPKTFFKKTADHAVIVWFRKMVEWVQNAPEYTEAAKADFAIVADGWVVAYAKKNGLVVVCRRSL
jgi:Domain of unknown function (DUF4411)